MSIVLHDVGPRDGLQAESTVVPVAERVAWIERLLAAGVDLVQAGSFVSPKMVPQMADSDEVCRRVGRRESSRARLTALVLNERGLERGLAAGVTSFCMGVSASDTHSRKNTGAGTIEAAERILATAAAARGSGGRVQLSVQSAFGCGYEGAVPESRVLDLVARFVDAGFTTISLADTAGLATPSYVRRLFDAIFVRWPDAACACHFHDTHALAMANAFAAVDCGVRYVETSLAGLGGCPFAAAAAGNVCTEEFVDALQRRGGRLDVNLDALRTLAADVKTFFGRTVTA